VSGVNRTGNTYLVLGDTAAGKLVADIARHMKDAEDPVLERIAFGIAR